MKSFKSLVLTFFLCFLFVSLVSARDKVILLNQGGGGSSSEWTLSGTGITPTTADSASNPGSYTSTASTGVFQFGTQASEGMRYSPVTGGGRLGIGTTAPAAPVDISPVSGDTVHPLIIRSPAITKGLYIDSQAVTANGFFYLAPHPDFAYAWKTDFNNGFWDIYEGTTFIARIGNGAFKLQDDIQLQFGEHPDYNISYDESGDDRLELKNSSGQDLMTVTAGAGIGVYTEFYNPLAYSNDISGDTPLALYVASSDGALGINPSSERFKTNIVDLPSQKDKFALLRPISCEPYATEKYPYEVYETDADGKVTTKTYYKKRRLDVGTGSKKASLLAEEVNLVYPEYVVRDKDGQILAIQYEPFIAMLIKRDQEQQSEIEALKNAQIDILKRLEALEAK